ALSAGTAEAALTAIRTAEQADVDMALYLTLILEAVRHVLLLRHAPELKSDLKEELGADRYGELEALATRPDSKLTHRTLLTLLDAASRMRFAPVPAAPLELALYEFVEA